MASEAEDNDGGGRGRNTSKGSRRLACPYHRRSPGRYWRGSCNGKGSASIHRLKTHIKEKHDRASGWQQCHRCKARFPEDTIDDHEPCVKQDKPVDYEDGFDSIQLHKLSSKETARKHYPSDEACWNAIFRMLLPDWPATEELPSAHQDHQGQTFTVLQAMIETHKVFRCPEILAEIASGVRQERGEPVVDRIFGGLGERLGLPSILEGRHQDAAVEENTSSPAQDLTAACPSPDDLAMIIPGTGEMSFTQGEDEAETMGTATPCHQSIPDFSGSPSQFLPPDEPWMLMDDSYHGVDDTQGHDSPVPGRSWDVLSSPARNNSDSEGNPDLFSRQWIQLGSIHEYGG
ncbi:hypothetical protein QBC35DRAFT_476260 [Podospora australis]|uniref:C2H2-type domain-containing protein n=1 Tax=Podospora australis TaxID=1536484 RepID=A0AAN7AEG7_9PEZI|nr:hypothetical protein QBC35DRAFT_476260 [Podospora australis]